MTRRRVAAGTSRSVPATLALGQLAGAAQAAALALGNIGGNGGGSNPVTNSTSILNSITGGKGSSGGYSSSFGGRSSAPQTDTRYTGNQATIAPSTNRKVFVTGSADESQTSTYVFNLNLIDKCVEIYHWRHGLYFDAEGEERIDEDKVAVLVQELFARSALITPNLDEASLLVQRALQTEGDMERAAGDLLAIVTATNEFITRPIADAFDVAELIAFILSLFKRN